ncbi:MAG: cation diffusion facilitator family transporter [Candidatus Zixiibacteriota bacterium]
MKIDRINKQFYAITLWGLLANVLLSLAKLIGGIFGRSSALLADALHSAGDILTDIATMTGIYFSKKPPDKNHKFGHGKFETVAGLFVGISVLITGAYLAYNGLAKTIIALSGKVLERPSFYTLIIAAISIIVKEILFRLTIKEGKEQNSTALCANAWHHRSDALSSVGALLGIGGAYVLGEKWILLDPLAAIVVSIFVIFASIGIIKNAISELMESSLCDDTEEEIMATIKSVEGVVNPHNLKTRKIGPNLAIDIHIEVAACMTVEDGHEVSTRVEETLIEKYGEETFISIHIEPAGTCEQRKAIKK